MKNLPIFYLVLALISSHLCFSQYHISGHLETPEKNKRVYLSLLRYDEQNTMSKEQILTSTVTDSTGYFSFSGSLLPDQHKLYRIHSNLEEDVRSVQFYDTDEVKNFHNFVFSNTDTIVFQPTANFWFSTNENSNEVDKEWRDFNRYKRKLRQELMGIKNSEAKNQFFSQLLAELKAYAKNEETHPLVTLILLSDIKEDLLKQDYQNDSPFYNELKNELDRYYKNASYAIQYNDLIANLAITDNQKEITFYKRATYILGAVCLFLLLSVIFLTLKLKKRNTPLPQPTTPLTNQEERVAELIILERSNKEIASELFISLSTVKTHVRNLYAKLDVSNRKDFADKFKNHPRD